MSEKVDTIIQRPYFKIPLMLTGLWWIRKFFKGKHFDEPVNAIGKIAVVTGSSSGIGRCIAEELNRRGAKVYMLCRNREKSEKVIAELVEEGCDRDRLLLRIADLCDYKSLRRFADAFRNEEPRIDILVNNASVIALPEYNLTVDGFEELWQSNFLGHVLLTELLLPQLKASDSSRVIFTSSRLHWFADTSSPETANDPKHYGRFFPYCRAKVALTMYSRMLAKRLMDDGIHNVTVNSFHPGMVNTPLYRTTPFKKRILGDLLAPFAWLFFKTPMDGAQTGLFLALSKQVEGITGKHFSECSESYYSWLAANDQKARQIYDYAMKAIQV
ncbi:oxidoreductaseshort chain dehydrogenase/reductase family protein [Aphelenchoides avenae]|nr:oxidoreductaseshort chain dehydrogenase/reductase family protein [Aphelenchus avenae]